ncbi:MAG: hypothetical protein R2864_08230 [Syntrophotaleaceae bacterium]
MAQTLGGAAGRVPGEFLAANDFSAKIEGILQRYRRCLLSTGKGDRAVGGGASRKPRFSS